MPPLAAVDNMTSHRWYRQVLLLSAAVGFFVAMSLLGSGKIWGMSVRVRALFIKHTRTGNPLVDSVRCAFVCAHFV